MLKSMTYINMNIDFDQLENNLPQPPFSVQTPVLNCLGYMFW